MKVTPKKVKGSAPNPSHTTLTHADIDRLSAAITTAIIVAQELPTSQETAEEPKHSRKTVKDIFRVFFCPLKKLKIQNSALSLVKIITSFVCIAISKLGYLCAILMVVSGIYDAVKDFNIATVISMSIQLLFATIVWLLSRLIAATGMELEQTNNENLVFGVSAFILAIIAIIVSM